MQRWPHQPYAVEQTVEAIIGDKRRLCVTSPTGAGKTLIIADMARWGLDQGWKVVLYTNRRQLVTQVSRDMERFGLEHGIRASGHADHREKDFQIASMQTEHARSPEAAYKRAIKAGETHETAKFLAELQKQEWSPHDAQLVLVDEGHLHTSKKSVALLTKHYEAGAAYVLYTATPLGLADVCDTLIQAGKTSELRACGALVPCRHFGCGEPDLKHIGKVALGEDLTEQQNVKAIMVQGIFGRVLEWWQKLNPEQKPTILFAPGVKESIWFAEKFKEHGISAAHIDGQNVWVNGEMQPTSQGARDAILEGSKTGGIRVVCNRFVLREGIDAPWLAHGIFATVFGSLQSYLQSGGRLLRAHPSLESVTLQDHGGNWWRHGSLNADREWHLEHTASIVTAIREDGFRQKKEREPVCCPKCGQILSGTRCPCGFEVVIGKKSRPVIQADGTLREMTGDIYRARATCKRPDGPAIWERMYWRSRTKKGARTFSAAFALFAIENNWQWPDRRWQFMPLEYLDTFRPVAEVPMDRLVPKECFNEVAQV